MRIAVAGAGLMGRWHAHAARKLGARVVAVADPDGGRARAVAGGAPIYEDAADMLDAERFDTLHVCAPSALHEPLIRLALARGRHVFVEKPIAPDAATTGALIAEADRLGLGLCPVHQYAFQRSVERVLGLRGRLGAPVRIELVFHTAGGDGVQAAARPRVAADILPHPLSILQRVLPPASVAATRWRIEAGAADEWMLSATIDGVRALITISLVARPTEASMYLWGTHGSSRADLFHDFAVFRGGAVGRSHKLARPFVDAGQTLAAASANLLGRTVRGEAAYPGLRALMQRFHRACEDGGPPPIAGSRVVEIAAIRDRFLAEACAPPRSRPRAAHPVQ